MIAKLVNITLRTRIHGVCGVHGRVLTMRGPYSSCPSGLGVLRVDGNSHPTWDIHFDKDGKHQLIDQPVETAHKCSPFAGNSSMVFSVDVGKTW